VFDWRANEKLWWRMAMMLHLPHWVTGDGGDEPY
jgi:hypothetical protein